MGNSTWSRWCRAFGVNPGGGSNKQAVSSNFDNEESNDNGQTGYNNQEASNDYNGEVYHDFTQAKHNNEYYPVGIDHYDEDPDINYAEEYDLYNPEHYDFKLLGIHQLNRSAVNNNHVYTTDDNDNLVGYNDFNHSIIHDNIDNIDNYLNNDCE